MNTTEYEHSREDIIAANPLLGSCQECGWQLRRDGRRWKCLCPLHNEDTPSFTIYSDKNLWRCFGCNTRGSVIDLHAKLRGLSIGEAMRDLSPHRGVSHGSNGSRGPAPLGRALSTVRPVKSVSWLLNGSWGSRLYGCL